jgi:fumarate hydratase class II
MIATQVIGLDVAVAFSGAGGYLEMNVYKPLIIHNVMESIRILSDGMHNFKTFLVDGMEANEEQIAMFLTRSLMLVTALSPVIGHDEAAKVAQYALANDLTLREAAMALHVVEGSEFDRLVDPSKMIGPSVTVSRSTGSSDGGTRNVAAKSVVRRKPGA